MTTRKNTLNVGDKSCRIILGEKTTFRVINILTRKITICLKKNTKIFKRLNISYRKQICHQHIKYDWGVRKPCGLAICKFFLSFTSIEITLLRTFSARQKSKGNKGSPCNT